MNNRQILVSLFFVFISLIDTEVGVYTYVITAIYACFHSLIDSEQRKEVEALWTVNKELENQVGSLEEQLKSMKAQKKYKDL